MEKEIKMATAVLCVCTAEFYREWTQPPNDGTIPVVGLLKHAVHATVSQGKSLARYAVILLDESDWECIPSLYLQGDTRQFLITKLDDIARFVQDIPSYTTTTFT